VWSQNHYASCYNGEDNQLFRMSYNKHVRANHFTDRHVWAAGKITIVTTASGLLLFILAFLFNLGQSEINTVSAQSTATTSVNVLNTPPTFNVGEFPREQVASASTTPTNSGDTVTFIATATDQNAAPYFLIVCAAGASAQAQTGDGNGSAPPICTGGETIAVSTSTVSGTQASVSTTTTEAMAEVNGWIAFACDDDATNPECSSGETGNGDDAFASPFVVNHRPVFSGIVNTGPVNPGAVLTFNATTSDTDTYGGNDTMKLHVCVLNDFDTVTNECGPGGTFASSSFVAGGTPFVLPAATTTKNPYPDDDYDVFVFVVDEHGHEASGGQHGATNTFTISNVEPTVSGALVTLNGGNNMVLSEPASTTDGFTLTYVVSDNNSCQNAAAGSEITNQLVSVYRSGIGSTTCDAVGDGDADADYNPNNCYPSDAGSSVWNISCVASSTVDACTGDTDATVGFECTFPLWYVADATDGGSVFEVEDWRAAVSAVDDDSATSTFTESTTAGIEMQQSLFFALDDTAIPFGSLAPGNNTVNAGSTTIPTDVRPTGNVGIDVNLKGIQMCADDLYAVGGCANVSGTSSIAVSEIKYNLTSFTNYVTDGTALTLADAELELDVPKATTTAPLSQPTRAAYWALQVPGTIQYAGTYTGRNTFTAVTAEIVDW